MPENIQSQMYSGCLDCVSAGEKPKILSPMKDVKALARSTGSMKCEIDGGQPTATITWYKEGRELYEGKKYNMSYKDNVAQLDIVQADLSDTSAYRVEADNKVARVESEAKFIVQGQPSLFAVRFKSYFKDDY